MHLDSQPRKIDIDDIDVRSYGAARTVADCFKHRNKLEPWDEAARRPAQPGGARSPTPGVDASGGICANLLMTQEESTQELVELGRQAAELSHELRNLLVRVVSLTESLRVTEGDEVDAQLVKKLDLLRTGARACRALVDDVLILAQPSSREARTATSVQSLLEDVAALAELPHGVRLVQGSIPDDLPAVAAAPQRVVRCLLNLVRNGAQAMAEADRTGDVTLTARKTDDNGVVIEVRDEGPGIPASLQSDLFEPFRTGKNTGLGLGLAVARRIAREEGGELALVATSEQGAAFTLRLPAASDEDGAAPENAPPIPKALPPDTCRTILLVEDDRATRESLRLILELEGLGVVETETAEEALDVVRRGGVDVVLADLNLPDMSGADFYDRLRKENAALARRCIFATGDVASPRALEFLNAIGVPYLIKPFDANDLRSALAVVSS